MSELKISRRYMEFMDRLEKQKTERRNCLAFNAILDRASGVS